MAPPARTPDPPKMAAGAAAARAAASRTKVSFEQKEDQASAATMLVPTPPAGPKGAHGSKLRSSVQLVNASNTAAHQDAVRPDHFKTYARSWKMSTEGGKKIPGVERARQTRMMDALQTQFLQMLDDIDFLHRCFDLLDGNDDSQLDAAELRRWISVINDGEQPSDEDMLEVLALAGKRGVKLSEGEVVLEDPNGVGIRFDDFLGIMQDYYTALGATHMRLIYVDMLVLEPDDVGVRPEEVGGEDVAQVSGMLPKIILPPGTPEAKAAPGFNPIDGGPDDRTLDAGSCACTVM